MRTLNLDLGARGYPIHIGENLLANNGLLAPFCGRRPVLVTDSVVADIYLDRLGDTLRDLSPLRFVLPAGETHKSLGSVERIWDFLIDSHCPRATTLVALGGGVIGDLVGFAAACYMRGIAFVQIPTTLLAQVDSSVGGKTGFNHALGKNMIGAFHQPRAVLIDIGTLRTLDRRQVTAGIAEVIKYGLIRDRGFFDWIEANIDALCDRDPPTLIEAVGKSCEIKAKVVSEDERETGERAVLNFGHTFGHALETATGYDRWLHGEAVGLGMVLAARLSQVTGRLSTSDVARIEALLTRAGLPGRLPDDVGAEKLWELMGRDKKVGEHGRRWVVLERIGHAVLADDIQESVVMAVLNSAR